MFEHLSRCDDDTASLHPRHQLDRDDAVAAEREERVVETDPRYTENFSEHLREHKFDVGLGRSEGLRAIDNRRRQRSAIHFAVGRQRQRIEYDHRVGNHVRRQELGDEPCGSGRFESRTGHRDEVGDQSIGCGRIGAYERYCLSNSVDTGKLCLDLAEFDAEATQLHLEVATTHVFQFASGRTANQIAGPVEASAVR